MRGIEMACYDLFLGGRATVTQDPWLSAFCIVMVRSGGVFLMRFPSAMILYTDASHESLGSSPELPSRDEVRKCPFWNKNIAGVPAWHGYTLLTKE